MKIMVHDYCGHPFQIHLSRELAARGHLVNHVYFADNHGPKGQFERSDNPASLGITGLRMSNLVPQTALLARRQQDITYGQEVADIIRTSRPDLVISGNTPTEAQRHILYVCEASQISFVYWLQDIYSIAVSKLVSRRLGIIGRPIGWYYGWLDRDQFRRSDAIVAISQDFVALAASWGRDSEKVDVIENWASLEDLPVGTKDNAWSREHGLHEIFAFLYSGTLGRKHNPSLLMRLAQEFGSAATVAVVGQGLGTQQLEFQRPAALNLLPLQPAERLPEVLASGDVLVATIERDAGSFAVPSKVQSYLCAGRPILLAAPATNLAARIVSKANAGIVVEPEDETGFIEAAARLRTDPALRAQFGANGRAYAEKTFDLKTITDRFERVFEAARRGRARTTDPAGSYHDGRTALLSRRLGPPFHQSPDKSVRSPIG